METQFNYYLLINKRCAFLAVLAFSRSYPRQEPLGRSRRTASKCDEMGSRTTSKDDERSQRE